jgi:putative endonuclease
MSGLSKRYYLYMMSNKHCNVLYTGVTNDLRRRVNEHKEKKIEGFSKQYNTDRLVYYEEFYEIDQAIAREKQIKSGSRKNKDLLVEKMNPEWKDLSLEFY